MRSLFRSLRASLVISASLCLGFVSSAQALPLADLLAPDESMVSGYLEFSQFAYSNTGDMAKAQDIMVDVFVDAKGNPGISITGDFMDMSESPGPSAASISYSVSVLDTLSPDLVVEAVTMRADFMLDGPGYANLNASVVNGSLALIQLFSHNFDEEGPTGVDSGMRVLTSPSRQINIVVDNIDAFAPAALDKIDPSSGFAKITTIEQTFTVVPEPETALLVGFGLAGLGLAGKQG
jgi:hypothetical protein